MPILYVITGPAGVGKSSVSQKLAERLPLSVHLEADVVSNFVVGGHLPAWKQSPQRDLFWKNVFMLTQNYLSEGYDVVLNYIVYKSMLQKIKKQFNNVTMKYVVLICDEQELIRRDKLRIEDWQMGERVLILLNDFKNQGIAKKYFIDNTELNINDTIDLILKDNRFLV